MKFYENYVAEHPSIRRIGEGFPEKLASEVSLNCEKKLARYKGKLKRLKYLGKKSQVLKRLANQNRTMFKGKEKKPQGYKLSSLQLVC